MEIVIHKKFYKQLDSLPANTKDQFRVIYQRLKVAANHETAFVDYKKLRQSKKSVYYSIRMGDYRIGAEYISPKIIIITVLRCGDFYKHFPPALILQPS